MTRPEYDHDELRALLDALCEESITAEQMRCLEELVLTHPEAEAYYVQYMSLVADLAGHFSPLPARAEQSLRERLASAGASERITPSRRFQFSALRRSAFRLSAVAAVLLVALALWPRKPVAPKSTGPGPEVLDHTVAVLLQAPGAEWEEAGLTFRPGAALPPGLLRLKSGFAHLEFYSGATVILEGPAELDLISRMEAVCTAGKLRATVPPHAQGFTIRSPKLHLVDRGPEFGLQVGAGGRTEVHVFQGKVELHDPETGERTPPHTELTTGQSVRLDSPGEVQRIQLDPAAFQTAQDLTRRADDAVRRRHLDWLAASETLRRDPDLLVYYPFQAGEPWDRTLADQARGRQQSRDGAIVGCTWVAGRWPGKQGLEFKRVSDRVRLHVPGEFDSLTLATWVRVDGLPNRNNSLMMTDGWEPGELHWQIGQDGTLVLGVQSDPKRGAY